jgi:hypothetical protein
MPPPDLNKPHDFEEFRSGQRPPILIVGSGLSHGLVPSMEDIVLKKKEHVERTLGTGEQSSTNGPYRWIRDILEALIAKGDTVKLKTLGKFKTRSRPFCFHQAQVTNCHSKNDRERNSR